jgi:hypothetical protein
MDNFDPEMYRKSLKEKLGIANMSIPKKLNKKDFIDDGSSVALGEENPTAAHEPITPFSGGSKVGEIPGANVDTIGAETEVPDENLAPAQAILDTLLQTIDEMPATDKNEQAMHKALWSYLHSNSEKICKEMTPKKKGKQNNGY